jgi:hypothetical protein
MGEAIMAQKSIKKTLLSLSVAVALGCSSGNVFANGGDRVEELEARVAELEALVTRLLENQEAVEVVDTVAVEARAEAIAEEKVTTMMEEYAAIKAAEEKAHSYKFGGYVKSDVIYSKYGDGASAGAGRDFYIPGTIPVGGVGESYLDFSAKESRVNFRSEHNLDNGAKMTTFFEMDFMLSSQGDERISNSYSPRVRHAFLTYNNWLFGQTWMTFFNVGALPENLDFVGPAESTIFGRQAQIRYTNGPWQFAAENSFTTITPYGGGGRIGADTSHIPDFVGRYNYSGDWGTFTVAGIYRQLRYEAAGMSDSTSGYGISVSGKFMIGQDDIRWMASTGKGLGRYIGLNTANGAVLDEHGDLHAIGQTGVFGSYRHLWSDTWRSNLTLGYLWIDNKTQYTGMNVTEDASSVHVNLIYSPQPKLDFGVEFIYASRDLESEVDGDLKRVMFSAKYAY